VRITQDRVTDPTVVSTRAGYLRFVLAAAVLAGVLTVLFGAGPLWASLLAVVDFGLYLYANRRIRTVKRRDNWIAGRRQGVTTDTTFRTDPVRLPWLYLLPAAAVLGVTAILGFVLYPGLPATVPEFHGFGVAEGAVVPTTWQHAFEPVLLQVGTTLLVPLVAFLVLRARPDLDAARPKGSARRYRVYLRGIALMTFVLAAAINLGLAFTALQLWDVIPATTPWRIATYAPLALMVVALVVWDRKVGSAGHRLPTEPGEEEEESPVVQRDDDENWFLGGLVYVNREDPAAFVHARIGHSWTMNLGNPTSWLVLATLALLAIATLTGLTNLPTRDSLF
jgi:uncharacterized membrane protein